MKQIAGATPTNYVRHLRPSEHMLSAYHHMTKRTCKPAHAQHFALAHKGLLLKIPTWTMYILQCFLS